MSAAIFDPILFKPFLYDAKLPKLPKSGVHACTGKKLSLLRARECHFIIAIVLPWDFLNSSSTCVVWYKSVTRESFSFQKFCEQLCSKLNFFAAFVNSAIDSIWDMKWSMINKMFFLIKIFYSRNQYWNIFLGWIFFRSGYFSGVNFFQGWIFFRGEYFSGGNIFNGLIFFRSEYFSGLNTFQGWIFFRGESFSGVNIFQEWIFLRVNIF